jgi:hypothetical protein
MLMASKRCSCVIYGPPVPPKPNCSNCFGYPNLIVLPADSVTANFQNGSVDLLEKMPSGYIADNLLFTLSSNGKGVKDLLITDNILSFTSVPELPINKYASVNIKVKDVVKNTSVFFNVKIGFKNLCVDVNCATCNPDTGLCLTAVNKDINSTCGASSTSDMKVGSVLTGCTGGTLTYNVVSYPSSITSATISSLGVLAYSISSAPIFGIPLPIKYEIHCSFWGLVSTGFLNITIPDLCIGVEYDSLTEVCDKCTGTVTDMETDLEITKSGVGFKNSGGVTFNQ